MMTLPGLMLFYAGLTGFKSVLSTATQTFAIASLITITWMMFGYSLAFGYGTYNQYIGGYEKFWFKGSRTDDPDSVYKRLTPTTMVGTIPETVFIMYQLAFAIFTAAITAAPFADRMKFHSLLIFMFFWHCVVYCPVVHWHKGAGYMARWGVLDFAGGNYVHIVAGVSGMVGSLILGPREERVEAQSTSESKEIFTMIGGALVWLGWFGFTAGCALSAGTSAGHAMLITHICASTCAFTWMLIEWGHSGKRTVTGILSGAITGLVIISPAAGYVDHTGAFCMGLSGAPICYGIVFLKNYLGLDQKPFKSNYPDAFGVHAIGGILGAIWLGFFANPLIGGVPAVFYGHPRQLGWQIVGLAITFSYAMIVTAFLMLCLKFTIGINETESDPAKMAPKSVPLTLVGQDPVTGQAILATTTSPVPMMPAQLPYNQGMHPLQQGMMGPGMQMGMPPFMGGGHPSMGYR